MKVVTGAKGSDWWIHEHVLTDDKEDIILKQLPIDDNSKQNLLQVRLEMFFDTVNDLAEQVYTGEITIGEWQELMKTEIRQLHTSAAAIGKGGWDNMGPRDWGRLGTPLRNEYRWLQRFSEDISNKRDTISLKQIQARARLYGHGAVKSAVQAEAGFYFEDFLPYLPRDGSTECLNRCHCYWSLDTVNTDGPWKIVEATWRLGEADHCNTCSARNGHVEVLRVPSDVEVPGIIGGY